MKQILLGCGLLATVFALGCTGGLTKKEARQGFGATSAALTSGETDVSVSGDSGQVTVVHDCIEGGTATFDGNWNGPVDDFAFVVNFAGCTVDGVTIDGDLNFSLQTEASQNQASVAYVYKGDLAWTGEVEGTCEIDVVGSVVAGPQGATIEHSGTVCGHPADETL